MYKNAFDSSIFIYLLFLCGVRGWRLEYTAVNRSTLLMLLLYSLSAMEKTPSGIYTRD